LTWRIEWGKRIMGNESKRSGRRILEQRGGRTKLTTEKGTIATVEKLRDAKTRERISVNTGK